MTDVSRVLMTADAQGGVWTYALELAAELGSRGVEVILAVMGGNVTAARRAEVERIRNVELHTSEYKLEWMDSPWDDVARAGDWLLRLADGFRPDVVHLNGYAHAALPWNAPVIAVAHSCVVGWFQAVRGQAAPAEWSNYRKAVTRGLQAADLVIAPSAFMLREVERHYGKVRRSRVIHNGCSVDAFYSGRKEEMILSAGRLWDEAKNVRVLADAAGAVKWPIYLAGEGPFRFEGVRTLGLLDRSEMSSWLRRASIYAHPALYEPFGLAVLEAALSGCALVLSDIPSLREIWGETATYVDPRDPAAWAFELNRFSQSCNGGLAAHERALQLTTSLMTDRYLDAYQQAQQIQSCALHSSVIPSVPTGIMETPTFSAG